jgi:hypothetical protein
MTFKEDIRRATEWAEREINRHKDKCVDYEQNYVLPCFKWAAEMEFDLHAAVRENPGKNCTELLVTHMRDEIRALRLLLREARGWVGPSDAPWSASDDIMKRINEQVDKL